MAVCVCVTVLWKSFEFCCFYRCYCYYCQQVRLYEPFDVYNIIYYAEERRAKYLLVSSRHTTKSSWVFSFWLPCARTTHAHHIVAHCVCHRHICIGQNDLCIVTRYYYGESKAFSRQRRPIVGSELTTLIIFSFLVSLKWVCVHSRSVCDGKAFLNSCKWTIEENKNQTEKTRIHRPLKLNLNSVRSMNKIKIKYFF